MTETMQRSKIEYSAYYDNYDNILGYVFAEQLDDCYVINQRQFNNACRRCDLRNGAGVNFHSDMPVYVDGVSIHVHC